MLELPWTASSEDNWERLVTWGVSAWPFDEEPCLISSTSSVVFNSWWPSTTSEFLTCLSVAFHASELTSSTAAELCIKSFFASSTRSCTSFSVGPFSRVASISGIITSAKLLTLLPRDLLLSIEETDTADPESDSISGGASTTYSWSPLVDLAPGLRGSSGLSELLCSMTHSPIPGAFSSAINTSKTFDKGLKSQLFNFNFKPTRATNFLDSWALRSTNSTSQIFPLFPSFVSAKMNSKDDFSNGFCRIVIFDR